MEIKIFTAPLLADVWQCKKYSVIGYSLLLRDVVPS